MRPATVCRSCHWCSAGGTPHFSGSGCPWKASAAAATSSCGLAMCLFDRTGACNWRKTLNMFVSAWLIFSVSWLTPCCTDVQCSGHVKAEPARQSSNLATSRRPFTNSRQPRRYQRRRDQIHFSCFLQKIEASTAFILHSIQHSQYSSFTSFILHHSLHSSLSANLP